MCIFYRSCIHLNLLVENALSIGWILYGKWFLMHKPSVIVIIWKRHVIQHLTLIYAFKTNFVLRQTLCGDEVDTCLRSHRPPVPLNKKKHYMRQRFTSFASFADNRKLTTEINLFECPDIQVNHHKIHRDVAIQHWHRHHHLLARSIAQFNAALVTKS